jgi:hypothetical protein
MLRGQLSGLFCAVFESDGFLVRGHRQAQPLRFNVPVESVSAADERMLWVVFSLSRLEGVAHRDPDRKIIKNGRPLKRSPSLPPA